MNQITRLMRRLFGDKALSTNTGDKSNKAPSSSADNQANDWQTQFSNETFAERRQVIIGLDFGTAFTKVVIGDVARAYAVPFSCYNSEDNPFLLPGVFSEEACGKISLGAHPGTRVHDNLKMPLLDGDKGRLTQLKIVAFLALVLRHSRKWFLDHHEGTFGRSTLEWCVNIGMPTAQYHDVGLTEFYKRIVGIAWASSITPGDLSLRIIEEKTDSVKADVARIDVAMIPEFVAQVNSYVKSPLRQRDLHLLIDVGAGTLDVVAFIVHENESGDVFPILAKSVTKFGVQFLPESQNDRVFFRRDIFREIRLITEFVKKNKYGAYFDRNRKNSLPFFLTGGGSNMEFYSSIARTMVNRETPCPAVRLMLPVPDRLIANGLPPDQYHRLSVAYGLSFDAFDIGQIVLEHEVADLPHESLTSDYQICPTCGGSGGNYNSSCSKCGGSGWVS